jgi:NADP-dependent 3-hydroxy acid dehydrogenase YdfG
MGALDGKSAIVTGASEGIGAATARALVDEGARVALGARRPEALDKVADELRGIGGEVVTVPTDVRDRMALQRLVDTTVEQFGGLDIIINNAGVGHWNNVGIENGDLDEWRSEIEINLVGLMELSRLASDVMIAQGRGGNVVNLSSGAGRFPSPEYPAYAASKHGVNAFTYSIMRPLRQHGIRVTLIEPGEVDTAMQDGEPPDLRAQMLRPADVADAIVWAITRPAHVFIGNLLIAPTAT